MVESKGIAMVSLAILITSLVSGGLQTVFGNPPSQSAVQFGIGAIVFIAGFGVVYGWEFYTSYQSAF